jgi:hypothetical protein
VAAYPTRTRFRRMAVCVTGPDPADREMAERDAQRLWENARAATRRFSVRAGLWRAVLAAPGAASGRLVRLWRFALREPRDHAGGDSAVFAGPSSARTAWMLTGRESAARETRFRGAQRRRL